MKHSIKLLIAIFVLTALVSCEKDQISEGNGRVTVKLTDAPFPHELVTQANVGITKVELKTTTGEYATLFESSEEYGVSYNMVELTNGVTTDVETTDIEVGTYVKCRVSIGSASVHFKNSSHIDMAINAESTYETSIEPALVVEEGKLSNVLFDLDVNRSFNFHESVGLPFGNWIESIETITGCDFDAHFRVCDLDETGTISGIVTVNGVSSENCYVTVVVGNNEIAAHTDHNGRYTFIGIVDGTYNVHVKTKNGEASSSVQVSNNDSATCDITIN